MQKQRISTDRFGQPYQVVGIKPNKKMRISIKVTLNLVKNCTNSKSQLPIKMMLIIG